MNIQVIVFFVSQPDNAVISTKQSDANHVDNRSEIHPDIFSGDLGWVLKIKSQRNIIDNECFFLLKNHFIPAKSFQFPGSVCGSQNRQFQTSWPEIYKGLTYSPAENGGILLIFLPTWRV